MARIMTIILLLFASVCYAEQIAVTDTGEQVILNSDGTWKYVKDNTPNDKIQVNDKVFAKPSDASFLLKSTRNKSAFYVNVKKWDFKKVTGNLKSSEYAFQLKGSDLYAQAITEGIVVPLDSLPTIALGNARNAAPDARITKQEYRTVNGNKVIFLEISGTIQGINFTYLGYYFSDDSGTTQLVAYTGTNLVKKYRSDIIDLLNGLTLQ